MQSLPLIQDELSQGAIGEMPLVRLATVSNVYIQSVWFLLSHLDHLDITVAESNEESVSKGVPWDGGHLVEFVSFGFFGGLLLQSFLSLKFETSFSNDRGIFGFKIPNLPSNFSSNSNPVTSGVEGKAVDRWSGVVAGCGFFNIAEIKNKNFLVFSSSHNEISSGGDSDSVDIGIMNSDAILDAEGLVVPDLEISVPSNWGEILTSNCGFAGAGDESNFGDPIVVVVLFDGVFAVSLDIPQFDISISTGGKDVPSVWGNSTGEDLFGVSVLDESLGGLTVSEIPKSHGFVPGCWEKIVVVVGQGEVADEVVVSSERLDGLSEIWDDLGFGVELPDKDGFVPGATDENLGVFILFLRVSSDDGGDPVGVTLEVTDFVGSDDALFCHGEKY